MCTVEAQSSGKRTSGAVKHHGYKARSKSGSLCLDGDKREVSPAAAGTLEPMGRIRYLWGGGAEGGRGRAIGTEIKRAGATIGLFFDEGQRCVCCALVDGQKKDLPAHSTGHPTLSARITGKKHTAPTTHTRTQEPPAQGDSGQVGRWGGREQWSSAVEQWKVEGIGRQGRAVLLIGGKRGRCGCVRPSFLLLLDGGSQSEGPVGVGTAARTGKVQSQAERGAAADWPAAAPPGLLAVFSKTRRTR